MGLRILIVCTGNVCRSPAAEVLMRARVDPRARVSISSAGVGALVGEGVDAPTAAALHELGVDPSGHRARQFEAWMAAEADLVLTAERGQRDAVMREFAAAHRRTFTLREFARLATLFGAGAGAGALPRDSLVAELSARRGAHGAVDQADDDIPDPYRGGLVRAREAVLQVSRAVDVTVAALGLTRPARTRPRPGSRHPRPVPRSRPTPGRR